MTGRLNKKKLASQEASFRSENERFHRREMLPPSVFVHMEKYGVDINKSYLINWFPDDYRVYIVDIIDQSGMVYRFDHSIDGEDEAPSDITPIFMDSVRRSTQKPWMPASIAWRAFKASQE